MKKIAGAAIFIITLLLTAYRQDPAIYAADAYDEEVISETEVEDIVYAEDFADDEELFCGYVESLYYPENVPMLMASGEDRLSEAAGTVYASIVPQIRSAASGELESTVFDSDKYAQVFLSTLGVQEGLTKDEVTALKLLTAAKTELAKTEVDTSQLLAAFLMDCPYDLYWFDKTGSGGMSPAKIYSIRWALTEDGLVDPENTYYSVKYRISFYVSAAYSKTGEVKTTTLDTEKTKAPTQAKAYADTIAAEAADMDAYTAMSYFCDRICELTSYNYSAMDSDNYGDPWQIIYVFDQDINTRVVCEGYAKAFSYLCAAADIESKGAENVLVTGKLNGDSHMWNMVQMEDGLTYIVDLTNVDGKSQAYRDALFLGGVQTISASSFSVTIDGRTISYSILDNYSGLLGEFLNFAGRSYLYDRSYELPVFSNDGSNEDAVLTGNFTERSILTADLFSRTGYHLVSFNTEADGSGTSYAIGDAMEDYFTDPRDLPEALYAQWEENTYLIRFRSASSSGETEPMRDLTYTGSYALPVCGFSKTGFTFVGWNTSSDYTGIVYQPGQIVSGLSSVNGSKVTLYAMWKVTAPEITSICNTSSGVKLVWTKRAKSQGYEVYRKRSGGSYELLASLEGASSVSYIDKTAENGTRYAYYVLPLQSTYGGLKSEKKAITALTKVRIISLEAVYNGVIIRWSENSNASGYIIYRMTNNSGVYEKVKTIKDPTDTAWRDKGANAAGSVYHYRIEACKDDSVSCISDRMGIRK